MNTKYTTVGRYTRTPMNKLNNHAHKWIVTGGLLALMLLAKPGLSDTVSATVSRDDRVRLDRGEVLLQTVARGKPGGAARVTALFHTNPDTVWDIIGYCKYEYIYVRGLKLCEVLEPGLFYSRMHHRVRNSWFTPTLDFSFEASRTSTGHGEIHLIDGDLKVLEGRWIMESLAGTDTILVVHEIRVHPKFLAARWLVRRTFRKDLPDMLACIRGLASASGNKFDIARDLKRCPG